MIKKINIILIIICGVLIFCNHALAASDDFISDSKITVSDVTFGTTTADLIIMASSSAESWSYDSGAFTVTNPDSINYFKVGSADSSVKAIRVSLGTTSVACLKNIDPGNNYVSLPSIAGTYSVEPLNINLANSASYNSACGAAACSSGYTISGSGSSAICIAQSSGGVSSGGGGSSSVVSSNVNAIGTALLPVSLVVSSTQNGNLAQTLADGSKVEITIPQGSVSSPVTISVTNSAISNSPAATQNTGITIVSNGVFNIKAVDTSNKAVSSFSKTLTITLTIPNLPSDTSNLGVYYLNETSKIWVLVPGAVFDTINNKVSFSVNHLTEFAVFKNNEIAAVTTQEENPVTTSENVNSESTAGVTLNYIKTVLAAEIKLVKTIDKTLTKRLLGRILMQVETLGRAWYLDPVSLSRYYLADGDSAFSALRKFGLGIKNVDIAKIPVGLESRFTMTDSDNDGLPDKLEEALGTDPNKADTDGDGYADGVEVKTGNNPLGLGKSTYSSSLINKLKGRIVLQTESKGEAWYINPVDGKRYYLANGEAAYQIMRYLSLGISNKDIQKIKVSELK
jgi:hypothetical protein